VKEAVAVKKGFAVSVWIKWKQLIIKIYLALKNISPNGAKFYPAAFLETAPDTSAC